MTPALEWSGATFDVLGMLGLTLLLVLLIWPNSERGVRLVCLAVAVIVLVLVLEPHRL